MNQTKATVHQSVAGTRSSYPNGFYGFPEVPFHKYLGIRFSRPAADAPALASLPSSPRIVGRDGTHSIAAVYTVGEVAAGIALCDALVHHVPASAYAMANPFEALDICEDSEAAKTLVPLVLTTRVRFRPGDLVQGEIRAETRLLDRGLRSVDQLETLRKTEVTTEARLSGAGKRLAGIVQVDFYVRLMPLNRLRAMAARTPEMGEWGLPKQVSS